MARRVYLDNAATTNVSVEVINEMIPCFNMLYGNANSLHGFGREAAGIIDRARDRVAKAINAAKSSEIYFTSGGTEANNWAIYGIAHAYAKKGKHIVTSQIEHHSVLATFARLKEEGFEVSYVPVDANGIVSLAELMHVIRPTTTLVSIMGVNNEVGTIQHIKAIAKTVHEKGAIFHCDCVQAITCMPIDVQELEIDSATISAHKIHGPKGIGALYLKNGIKIRPLIVGGEQEREKRGGTTNVPAIAGFGRAIETTVRELPVYTKKMKQLSDYFIAQVREKIEHVRLNGHSSQRARSIVNFSFECIEGESILLLLDMEGIAVSTGSACASGSLEKSYVLKAMRIPDEIAQGTVRFSFGRNVSKDDVDFVVEKLVQVVAKLRSFSPITKAGRKGGKK